MHPSSGGRARAAGRMTATSRGGVREAPQGRRVASDKLAGDDRYSRQSRFWAIGPAGQERIRAGHVVVVGCGALGSADISLLARAGVGRITVVDRDFVELSNLQRQLLFEEADAVAGVPKAIAAARAVARINSTVEVRPFVADVTAANVEGFVAGADVVLDGTDNFETRYLVNDACVKLGVPWVYGGAVGSTGMSMTIVPGETACFRCLFPAPPPVGSMETCETAGVLASGIVTVAAIQAAEALKILVGDRENRSPGLTAVDVVVRPHVHRGQLRASVLTISDEDLEGLGGLDRRNRHDARREYAGRLAGLHRPDGRRRREEAPKARGLAGHDGHGHPRRTDRSAVDPRDAQLHAGIVDEVAGLEVVGPVEHDIRAGDVPLDVGGGHVGHERANFDRRVDAGDGTRRGDRLRDAGNGIGLLEEQLALEIAQLDEIPVDDRDPAHARAGEEADVCRSQGAAADHDHVTRANPLLSRRADRPEPRLARVPIVTRELVRCHSSPLRRLTNATPRRRRHSTRGTCPSPARRMHADVSFPQSRHTSMNPRT